MEAAIVFWLVIAIVSFISQCIGCFLLSTQKGKKDLLLLHLSGVELALIIWDSFFCIRYLVLAMDLIQPSKLYITGVIILVMEQIKSIILITVDRVLAVKLTIRYRIIVTRKRMNIVFAVSWLLSISHGVMVNYISLQEMKQIRSAWEILVTLMIITGYGYIIVLFQYRKRKLEENHRQIGRTNLKLTVPGLILLTYIILCVIPDLLLSFGTKFTLWILGLRYLNMLTDSLIYTFGSGRIRSRIRNAICQSSTSIQNITLHRTAVRRYPASTVCDSASRKHSCVGLNERLICELDKRPLTTRDHLL